MTLNATGSAFDMSFFDACLLDEAGTESETILECRKEGSRVYLTTIMSEEATAVFLASNDVVAAQGDRLLVKYELDATTLTLLSGCESIRSVDGTDTPFLEMVVEYDAEMPEECAEMLKRVNDSEEKCTVTLVLDPGEAHEREVSMTLPKGDIAWLLLPDGYESVYLDKGFTQTCSNEFTAETDITVYTRPLIKADTAT